MNILNSGVDRRHFIKRVGLMTAGAASGCIAFGTEDKGNTMYGLIGKIKCAPDGRDELMQILLDGTRDMPGCLQYVVAKDSEDSSALWITEVWKDQASHRASLELPKVHEAIAKGRNLIEDFEQRIETAPVGGHGLDL